MFPFFQTTYNYLLNILAPPFCRYCKTWLLERKPLCADCALFILPVVSVHFPIKGSQTIPVYAIGKYQDPLKYLILAKQWSDISTAHALGFLLWKHSPLASQEFDVIVPVPLHWTRYAQRGYNQAEHMADAISKLSGKPVFHGVTRAKRTQFQATLEFNQRQKNLKDAFVLSKSAQQLKGKKILIIDDLFTSGATIKGTALELLKVNPEKIIAAVACRA